MSSPFLSRQTFWLVVGGPLFALVLRAPAARAQTSAPSTDAKAKAGALWREGRDLRDQQRHAEACAKFRQSLEVLRAPGTLLNVGSCFVLESNPEQAYLTFEQAIAAAATEDGSRRSAFIEAARRELAALEPQLAKVAIRYAPTPGLEIQVIAPSQGHDRHVPLERANRLLLKPGAYQLRATAPGREPFSRPFEAAAGVPMSLTIPPLRPRVVAPPSAAEPTQPVAVPPRASDPPPEPSASKRPPASEPPASEALPPPPADEEGTSARLLPWVLTGAGAAVVSAGIVTGIVTSSKEAELKDGCADFVCPDEPGWQDKIEDTERLGVITDVLWGAGLASIGVGVALMLLDEGGDAGDEETHVDAGCLGGSCSVTLQGRF